MPTTQPTFLGFVTKRVAPAPDAFPSLTEICSVCECISTRPDGWVMRWLHNDAGFYNSEELAWEVTPAEQRADFTLFGYRVHPVRFEDGHSEVWEPAASWADLPTEKGLSGYEMLGFDLVGRGISDFFECSPLSCNYMANEITTNARCLLQTFEEALAVGLEFSRPDCGVEPAAYHVVEVWRSKV